MKNFLYYWLPVFLYAVVIFYFSSLPRIPPEIVRIIPETFILHAIEYAIFTFLLFRAFTNSKNIMLKNNKILLSIIIATVYGIINEFYQNFIPGRIYSVFDMIANFIGSLLVTIFNIKFYNRIRI